MPKITIQPGNISQPSAGTVVFDKLYFVTC